MWNEPSKEQLAKIPRLYVTEYIPLKEKQIYLHFFIGGCDWYIAEFDGDDLFWGFAILNNDIQNAEWGYVSFQELKEILIDDFLEIDCETPWNICKASDIYRISEAHGWRKENQSQSMTKEHELIMKTKAVHF